MRAAWLPVGWQRRYHAPSRPSLVAIAFVEETGAMVIRGVVF